MIILPYEFQTREINCHTKYLMPQEILVKKLKKLKINYSNYTKDFCAYPKSKTLFYKFDPMHLSKKGHLFVFNLVKNEM